jgi:hypothetical protein
MATASQLSLNDTGEKITNNSRHQQTTAFALHQMTSGTASFAEQRTEKY